MATLAFLWLTSALQVTVVAPENPRKEGGLLFNVTLEASTLQDVQTAFIEAHRRKFPQSPYSEPLRFAFTKNDHGHPVGTVVESLDNIQGSVSLRLYKSRGVREKKESESISNGTNDTSNNSSQCSGDQCDDPAIAFHNLALGGNITKHAAERLLHSKFRHPYLPMRVLFMLSNLNDTKEEDEETYDVLLKLLMQLPLDQKDDRHQAMLLARCTPSNWHYLVQQHYAEFPKAEGVLRVARDCNPNELRAKLLQLYFKKTESRRDRWAQHYDPVEDYIGQQYARNLVFPLLNEQMFKRRISDDPLSFLFLGPSGTGKTELARRIASILHNAPIDELIADGRFVEFKMGNYATEEQFAQWVGVPDGVKGGEGHLTLALKKHPNAVIYLDEIEKARPSAGDRLLGFLDAHGSLQVAKSGELVRTKHATWILSSNIATNEVLETWNSYVRDGEVDYESAVEAVARDIQAPLGKSEMFRRPELRNRLSAVVPFTPFRGKEVEQIVQLQLERLQRKYAASSGYRNAQINWVPDVIKYFTKESHDETLKKGNVRALIKRVEMEVNTALSAAMFCDRPVCDALAPEGYMCSASPDKARFLIDIHKPVESYTSQVIALYTPASIEEAQLACDNVKDEPKSNITYGKAERPVTDFWSFIDETRAGGGLDVDTDKLTDHLIAWWWEYSLYVSAYWDRLRVPTVMVFFFTSFWAYGLLWAVASFALVSVLEYAFVFAKMIWTILPQPMRDAIIMGGKQLGGFLIRRWDITVIILVVLFGYGFKYVITSCCCRRRKAAETKHSEVVKLILETIEARDQRLLKLVLDSLEERNKREAAERDALIDRIAVLEKALDVQEPKLTKKSSKPLTPLTCSELRRMIDPESP